MALVGLVAVAVVALQSGGGDPAPVARNARSLYTFKTADLHSLTFDPADQQRVLFGHHGGVMGTSDGGNTWADLVDRANFDGMNLAFDPAKNGVVYLAGHNVIAQSDDGGSTWTQFTHNLPGLDLHGFSASPTTPGRFYAFAMGRGLYVSEGGPAYWAPLWPEAPAGTHSIAEMSDGTLVLGSADRGILRSEDGGKTWTDSGDGIGSGVVVLSLDGQGTNRVYAGTSAGVYASADGGRSWQPTSLGDAQIIVVGVNPLAPENVLAIDGGGRLYRSADGGATWG